MLSHRPVSWQPPTTSRPAFHPHRASSAPYTRPDRPAWRGSADTDAPKATPASETASAPPGSGHRHQGPSCVEIHSRSSQGIVSAILAIATKTRHGPALAWMRGRTMMLVHDPLWSMPGPGARVAREPGQGLTAAAISGRHPVPSVSWASTKAGCDHAGFWARY